MNFLIRTVTAILFGALMLFSIQMGGALLLTVLGLVTVLTAAEFAELAVKYKNSSASRVVTAVLALLFYLCAVSFAALHSKAAPAVGAMLLICLVMALVRELYARKESPIVDMAYTVFPVIYVALPMALLAIMGYEPGLTGLEAGSYSPAIPLMLFICIWANDVGAYCTGCTLGRHKLFERVSPKKTWEGSCGGAVLTVVAAWALVRSFHRFYCVQPLPVWIGMALIIVLFGTWGDLVESLMKREMGIKDSGKILPGHGGMLDRFDSTLMAIPAVAAYFALVLSLSN